MTKQKESTSATAGDESLVLDVRGLSKVYSIDRRSVGALDNAELKVRRGEFVAIMGASGSGKSTLLHLIGGLDRPTQGSIIIEGQDLGTMTDRSRTLFRRRQIGIVFQAYNLLPTLTALENVALPAQIDGVATSNAKPRARELLERFEMGHRLDHRPQALSGGEQQRVAIARALMNNPALLLADEPTGNLDSRQGPAIWALLKSLTRDGGCTVIAVTHEPDGAAYADRVVVLRDGRTVGEIHPSGEDYASFVASRYRELVD